MTGMFNNQFRQPINPGSSNTTSNKPTTNTTVLKAGATPETIRVNRPTQPSSVRGPLTKNMISAPIDFKRATEGRFQDKRNSEIASALRDNLIIQTLNNTTLPKEDRYNLANLHSTTGNAQINVLLGMGVDSWKIENALSPTSKPVTLSPTTRPVAVSSTTNKPTGSMQYGYNQYQPDDQEIIIQNLMNLLKSLLLHVIRCN